MPFDDNSTNEMLKRITQAKISYPQTMSKKLQNLLTQMFQVRPDQRPNWEQIVNDPWVKELGQEAWASLREEVLQYKPQRSAPGEGAASQLKFNNFGAIFMRKLLSRNLQTGHPLKAEMYTARGSPRDELARLEAVFAEEITLEVERWVEGSAQFVGSIATREVPGE